MKVLIITYYWPPAGGSGVQRWLKFTKYLPEFGVTPIIYTVQNAKYPITDATLCKEVADDMKVITQPFKDPQEWISLRKSKKVKASAGFLSEKPTLTQKILNYIRANYFIPDAKMWWIQPSVKYLKKYLSENPVDVIISTGPPHSTHLIAFALKKQLPVKWIADFRDPWTEIDYFHQLPLTKKSLLRHQQLEKMVLTNADEVLVVGETMRQSYLSLNKNVTVITNGFDGAIEDKSEIALDKEFTITHVGMLNADRNPLVLWRALHTLRNEVIFKVRLIGKVAPEVVYSIEQFGLTDFVELIDYLPHHQVKEYQEKSQLLLLLINKVPSAKGIVTGKIFEYLQAQRPILAIGPTDGDLATILNDAQAGNVIDFDDEKTFVEQIRQYYEAYTQNNLKVQGVGVEKYHRKNLTKSLVTVLNKYKN